MRELRLVSSLERTPVSLSASPNLDRIRKKSVHIATVETVELLDDIEVVEESTLIDKKILARYARYLIEPEYDMLVHSQAHIQKYRRNNSAIDKWHRK